MYADLGISTVAVDIDPQANLSTMFLEEVRLEELWPDGDHPQSIMGAVSPILRGTGDISEPHAALVRLECGRGPEEMVTVFDALRRRLSRPKYET